MIKYTIINPTIVDPDVKVIYETDNPEEAAKLFWDSFAKSGKISKEVPSFYFTLTDEDGKFYDFHVEETREGDEVKYTITAVENKLKEEERRALLNRIKQMREAMTEKQMGGRRRRYEDDDDDDDKDDDDFEEYLRKILRQERKRKKDVVWWGYNPLFYPNVYDIWIPTPTIVNTPYVHVWTVPNQLVIV